MNFVFFMEYKSSSYYEIANNNNVKFIERENFYKSRLLNKFFHLSFSSRVNSIFNIPWKKLFYKSIYKKGKFENCDQTVFVFYNLWYEIGFCKWLRKHYPEIKIVVFFDDSVNLWQSIYRKLNPCQIRNNVDLVLSYNPEDCKKYGFVFSQVYFDKWDEKSLHKCDYSDLIFIGNCKDRLGKLTEIQGYIEGKCKYKFMVTECPTKNENIISLDSGIPYDDFLSEEISSNCILELIKGDTKGPTLRCWDAVYYNKKLLTNWPGIFDFPYYNPKYMQYFDKVEDISVDFITNNEMVDYKYKGDNSSTYLLKKIEECLQQQ